MGTIGGDTIKEDSMTMTIFEAVTANNGWAMAATGVLIVVSGLAVLALVISQLHKIIALFEKRKPDEPMHKHPAKPDPHISNANLLKDLDAVACTYRQLTSDLGSDFELSKLYSLLNSEGVPHPHLTIRSLREEGYLVSAGNGTFCWNGVDKPVFANGKP